MSVYDVLMASNKYKIALEDWSYGILSVVANLGVEEIKITTSDLFKGRREERVIFDSSDGYITSLSDCIIISGKGKISDLPFDLLYDDLIKIEEKVSELSSPTAQIDSDEEDMITSDPCYEDEKPPHPDYRDYQTIEEPHGWEEILQDYRERRRYDRDVEEWMRKTQKERRD